MSRLAVHARFTSRPGRGDELVAAVRTMCTAAQQEDGTILYAAHRDRDDPDVVVMYELYASDEALAAHGRSPAAEQFGAQLDDLLGAEPEVWFSRPFEIVGWQD